MERIQRSSILSGQHGLRPESCCFKNTSLTATHSINVLAPNICHILIVFRLIKVTDPPNIASKYLAASVDLLVYSKSPDNLL